MCTHLTFNHGVEGSSPSALTKQSQILGEIYFRIASQILALGSGGKHSPLAEPRRDSRRHFAGVPRSSAGRVRLLSMQFSASTGAVVPKINRRAAHLAALAPSAA